VLRVDEFLLQVGLESEVYCAAALQVVTSPFTSNVLQNRPEADISHCILYYINFQLTTLVNNSVIQFKPYASIYSLFPYIYCNVTILC
jgi:hypothetical protein